MILLSLVTNFHLHVFHSTLKLKELYRSVTQYEETTVAFPYNNNLLDAP